ncbi:MAG: hypothetical protein LBS33_02265 [Streptococcaceae bacterium]|nr:hypothetical protein [Streptococcaceae bacterium]
MQKIIVSGEYRLTLEAGLTKMYQIIVKLRLSTVALVRFTGKLNFPIPLSVLAELLKEINRLGRVYQAHKAGLSKNSKAYSACLFFR